MTNAGFVVVVVTEFAFETGKVIGNEDDTSRTVFIDFSPSVQYDQTNISTMMLPHRLRYGESFKVLFERKLMVRESAQIGGGNPTEHVSLLSGLGREQTHSGLLDFLPRW